MHWVPVALLLASLGGCADLKSLNSAIDENRQAVTGSTAKSETLCPGWCRGAASAVASGDAR